MPKDPYDIRQIFEDMTLGLINSLKRNLKRHQDDELKEGFRWEQWQASKLRALVGYQKTNRKLIQSAIKDAEQLIGAVVKESFESGIKRQESLWNRVVNWALKPFGLRQETSEAEIVIPEDIKPKLPEPVKNYLDMPPPPQEEDFFGLNEKKLEALQEGIQKDLRSTAGPIYRKMDDVYRQVVYRTSHYVAAGAKTIDQAVDMATKEFLSKGIDVIQYADGRKMNIDSYAEMALRTVSQRATFLGEGKKRDEWGVYTVVMSAHDNCSPWCMPFQGTVMVDDVYTSISKEQAAQLSKETGYVLLSHAMAEGAFHPNCRHTLATFFPGISRMPDQPDESKAERNYEAEQHQRYLERNIRMYKRLEAGSLEESNQARYGAKVFEWQGRLDEHLAKHDHLKRDGKREQIDGEVPKAERTQLLKAATDREKIEKIRKHILSDAQPKSILKGQHNKHVPGTHEYNQYVVKLKKIGQYGPARITATQEELEALVKQYAGTGGINLNSKGLWDKKETIIVNDKVIGVSVNNLTGQEAETTVFRIHYGDKGIHIVPDYPSKKKRRGGS